MTTIRTLSRNENIARYRRNAAIRALIISLVGSAVVLGGSYLLTRSSSEAVPSEMVDRRVLGESGLPLPRFVSLRANKVYMRNGPSRAHSIVKIFTREKLPLEVIREFDVWRQVKYVDGSTGWIHQVMLAGKRHALVMRPEGQHPVPLELHRRAVSDSEVIAKLEQGVLVGVNSCDGNWCEVVVDDYRGYLRQNLLWGVYDFERFT